MKVLDSLQKSEINDVIIEYINEKAVIFSDKIQAMSIFQSW
jgi:hypothetical protein